MIWKVNKYFNTIFTDASESKLAHPKLWGQIQILQDLLHQMLETSSGWRSDA